MLNMGKFALQLTHIMLLTDSNSNCNKSNHQHYLFISLWTTPAWYSILRCIFGMFNWHISKISQCYFVLDCIVLIGIISGIFSSCVPTIFDFFYEISSNPTPIPTTATLFRGTYFPLIDKVTATHYCQERGSSLLLLYINMRIA